MKPRSSFGFQAPEESPGFLLWQTTTTWQKLIKKALDTYNISHAQFVIMAVLLWFEEHQQDPTQITIAHLSKLDKMTVSKSLKKLMGEGYIKREESQKDSRAKLVTLTSNGKKLVSTLVPLIENIDKDFFDRLARKNQKILIKLLNNLVS